MNKVLILKGLIASGKTTKAKELVKKKWVRVNKDDLRAMLNSGIYSRNNEKFICAIRNAIIDLALIYKKDIVVDDTNFEQKHFNSICKIADINGAELEVDFIKTSLEECIKRDKMRENSVGEKVIRTMAERYIH